MIPRTVLLVDDSEGVRCTFAALLEDDGHRVIEAGTLAEARARLEAPLDLAIVDLHLPDGRGTELVPALRQRHPAAVIILMTGDTVDFSVRVFDLILTKDCTADEVMREAEPFIAAKQASVPSRSGDKVAR